MRYDAGTELLHPEPPSVIARCCAERRGTLLPEVRAAQAAAGAPLPRLPALRPADGAPSAAQSPQSRPAYYASQCAGVSGHGTLSCGWQPTCVVLPVRSWLGRRGSRTSPFKFASPQPNPSGCINTTQAERMAAAALSDLDLTPATESLPETLQQTCNNTLHVTPAQPQRTRSPSSSARAGGTLRRFGN